MNKEIMLLGIEGETGYPLHVHQDYELLYYFEADGYLRSSCGDIPLHAGLTVVIPPGISHGTDSETGFKALMIRGDFGGLFRIDEPVPVCDNETRDAEALARMILRNRLSRGEYLNALTETFLHFVLQNSTPEDAITVAVRKIATEISERFFDLSLSPAALLNESGYAEDYIRAHFKKVMGKTPTDFLNTLRINHAVYLIEYYRNTLTLAEVSARCGFNDYVYFSKKFREQMGCSPKNYRKGCIGGKEHV